MIAIWTSLFSSFSLTQARRSPIGASKAIRGYRNSLRSFHGSLTFSFSLRALRRPSAQALPDRRFLSMSARANHRFEGTAEKLRFSVPRGLRPRAAPQAKR